MELINFKDLEINENILKAITDMGFETPSEIQAKAIPILLNTSKDFIGQAQTGTGKTAAFGIPMLEKVDQNSNQVQALVLAPTRELAIQVEKEIKKLGSHTNIKTACIYGGASYTNQIADINKKKPQIVVGTPGRILDFINKKLLRLDATKFCVLDEADEMLNMGFYEDVKTILDLINHEKQLIMFSATMPRAILSLIKESFNDYELVKIERKSLSNSDIEQKYFVVKERYFKEALARLIEEEDEEVYAIVFCKTKIETKSVGDDLRSRGYNVEVLNGDLSQFDRDRAMQGFRDKKFNIMVCTDVAARGIDVTNLTHVFNYGLPQNNESYVHRIGRTGRAGMKGKAYTLIGPRDSFIIKKIESHVKTQIDRATLPSTQKLKERIIEKEMITMDDIVDAIKIKGEDYKLDPTFQIFENKLVGLSTDQVLKAVFTWKFNKAIRAYDNGPDIEADPGSSRGGRGDGGDRNSRRRSGPSRGGDRDRQRRPSSYSNRGDNERSSSDDSRRSRYRGRDRDTSSAGSSEERSRGGERPSNRRSGGGGFRKSR